MAATLVVAAAAGSSSITVTNASFTDAATVSSGELPAAQVLPPDSVTCTGGGLLSPLTFSWPNKDVRYRYRVTIEQGSTVKRTDFVNNNGTAGTTQSITFNFTLLNGLVGLPAHFTVRVRSQLVETSAWESGASATDTGQLLSLGLIGLASDC